MNPKLKKISHSLIADELVDRKSSGLQLRDKVLKLGRTAVEM